MDDLRRQISDLHDEIQILKECRAAPFTQEQIDGIVKRVAASVISEVYRQVGKSVIDRFVRWLGMAFIISVLGWAALKARLFGGQ